MKYIWISMKDHMIYWTTIQKYFSSKDERADECEIAFPGKGSLINKSSHSIRVWVDEELTAPKVYKGDIEITHDELRGWIITDKH